MNTTASVAASFPLGFTWSILDTWIVVVGMLSAVAAALLGNFLVLRRMSMLGDAITHAVLPGIAIAFLVSHSRNNFPMFIGAVIVGVLTALFTEWIRGIGRVDEGASMGVVFTSLFALGLVLLVQGADSVDLDPDCVLHGSIESVWLDVVEIGEWEIPRAAIVLSIVTLINALFVSLFFKELRISSFDPALSDTMGISSKGMHYTLMILVSVTAVACFESVGSILVVAMFVVPPAAAYMMTDRLSWMILLSLVLAVASAVFGHLSAITVPTWFGYRSMTTSGMIAVVSGFVFLLAACFSPRHGVVIKALRRRQLARQILCDDIVALLYRFEEKGTSTRLSSGLAPADLSTELFASPRSISQALKGLAQRGELERLAERLTLSETGRLRAQKLVRSHRLWEQYLVAQADDGSNRIHARAHQLEHFTERELRDQLDRATDAPKIDPHGSPIPEEQD